jgi:hypothetical protein
MCFLKRAITFICNIPTTLAGTNAIYLKTKFSFFIYVANGYHYIQTQLFVILNTSWNYFKVFTYLYTFIFFTLCITILKFPIVIEL